ncbi:MAG TPA: hypothetical protein VGW12_21880 [Pyrinomonadaceae bacterium]|nr:hypothetical protein [Pyrinomonadaceae bacterium]
MRRSILIFGMLLTLTAGVCGGVSLAAYACCAEEAGALAASDEHDCCRANIGYDKNSARRPESHTASPDGAHENLNATPLQTRDSHTETNCSGADASAERHGAALGRDDLSCGECCAGGSGRTPATVLVAASEGNKTKRDARYVSSDASRDLFAHVPARVSQLAARPHAPPHVPARLHVLHSLFLI